MIKMVKVIKMIIVVKMSGSSDAVIGSRRRRNLRESDDDKIRA